MTRYRMRQWTDGAYSVQRKRWWGWQYWYGYSRTPVAGCWGMWENGTSNCRFDSRDDCKRIMIADLERQQKQSLAASVVSQEVF